MENLLENLNNYFCDNIINCIDVDDVEVQWVEGIGDVPSICVNCHDNIRYCEYHCEYEYHEYWKEDNDSNFYCYDSQICICSECDCAINLDYENIYFDSNDNILCESCYNDNRVIEDADFDEYEKIGFSENHIYYGFEFETANSSSVSNERLINSTLDDVGVFKKDCSITGVEFVTHILGENVINEYIEKICTNLLDMGFHTQKEGIHIHISRTRRVDELLPYWVVFFEKNKEFILKISNRDEYEFNKWCHFYDLGNLSLECVTSELENEFSRYRCINVTNNETVEFRIFNSSLNIVQVKGYYEFIKLLVHFPNWTMNTSIVDLLVYAGINISEYRHFLEIA